MSDETQDRGEHDPDDEKLIVVCIPSLVATLLNRERAKGSPLTEAEVLDIRDNCPARRLTLAEARAVEARRGYPDIDPAQPWEQWQVARLDFLDEDDDEDDDEEDDEDDDEEDDEEDEDNAPQVEDGADEGSNDDTRADAGSNSSGHSSGHGSKLIIFIDPALVTLLHSREREKGSPLSEDEVLEIRDNSQAIVLEPEDVRAREAARGFKDIDPERAWEEWQEARLKLPQD